MDTTDFRALPSAAQEDIRRKAVNAVEAGMPPKDAARRFGVSRQAVTKWKRLYLAGGEKALSAKPRGAPKRSLLLKPRQCALAVHSITDKCPDQLKLPGFWLWTRDAVRDYLRVRFGVTLSLSSVGRLLKRWGLTPQKPAKRAYQRDDLAGKKWLEETYPQVREFAKQEGARVMWGDECGLGSDQQTGTTYGRKGQTPVVPSTDSRFSCHMVLAIDNAGHLAFKMFEGGFTGEVCIDFMKRLTKHGAQKVFLIVDNLSVYKSDKVRQWVEKNSSCIRLFFLPKYSPDLNPKGKL
jgi:transposase